MLIQIKMLQERSNWFFTCLKRSTDKERFICPNCKSSESVKIDQKLLVSQLRECSICNLRFRTPIDFPSDNYEYYQEGYSFGFTTDMPKKEHLEKLLSSRFEGHEKSYSRIIQLLRTLYPQDGVKLLDFGCSWGYGSWQLQKAGFHVFSYEISEPRAKYARQNLGIDLIDLNSPPTGIDIFFSNHVLEHVPEPSKTISLARKILNDDGIFVCITPNGSDSYRDFDYNGWHSLWGKDHPNHINDTFYESQFIDNPYLISSIDNSFDHFDHIQSWNKQNTQVKLSVNSSELLLIAYPNKKI